MNDLAAILAEQSGDALVVRLTGEVDLSNVELVRREIISAIPDESRAVVVDLSPTVYLDSAGIRMIFELAERLRTHRVDLRLVVPHDGLVHRVLELTGVIGHVPTNASLDEALAAT